VTQTHNNCGEIHRLWSYEPFCLPVAAIARAYDPTVIASVTLKKGPRRLCSHRSDCCRALMFTCRNYPCGNVVSAVIMFCLRFGRHGSIKWSAWTSRDMCVNWNKPSVSRALKDAWVRAGGCKRRYPKVRVEPATRSAVATWSNLININNLTARRKRLQRFWLHPRDHYHAVTQTYNNCTEIYLGGGVMSPFVSQLSAIARAHDPVV